MAWKPYLQLANISLEESVDYHLSDLGLCPDMDLLDRFIVVFGLEFDHDFIALAGFGQLPGLELHKHVYVFFEHICKFLSR